MLREASRVMPPVYLTLSGGADSSKPGVYRPIVAEADASLGENTALGKPKLLTSHFSSPPRVIVAVMPATGTGRITFPSMLSRAFWIVVSELPKSGLMKVVTNGEFVTL